MRFLLFLTLFITHSAFAQRALNRETFMVNVRPVLNGILSDFYQMVTLFPDFPKDIVPLIQELDTLTSDKEFLRESCPTLITVKCKEQISSLRLKLSTIQGLSNNLLKRQQMTSTLHINSLAGLRVVSEFDSELEEIKGLIANASFLLSANIPQKKETYTILKELDELNTILSLAVVEFIPFLYREDFKHFYFNFINPLQFQISKNKNYEFMNRNINTLNFAINLLNMQLTKRKKTPEGMGPYLATMHNRWNSILRYYW